MRLAEKKENMVTDLQTEEEKPVTNA